VGLGVALSGCAGGLFGGSSVRNHYYRLDVPDPGGGAEGARFAGVVLFGTLDASGPVASRNLVYWDATTPHELHRRAHHLWLAPTPLMVRDVLAGCLGSSGIAEAVVTPGYRVRGNYLVSGRMGQFEQRFDASPSIVVELELALVRVADRSLLLLKTYREEAPLPAGDSSVDAVVRGFQHAVAEVCRRFVGDMATVAGKDRAAVSGARPKER